MDKFRILLSAFIFLFSPFYTNSSLAQTIPVDGDIVFTQIGSDAPDVIEFVTLKRLNLTTLKITDKGILSDGTLRSGEGSYDLSNTTWSDIPGGTFIRLGSNLTNDNDASDRIIAYNGTGSGTLPNITINGDQCIAYLGSISSPTYIAGLNFGNAGWNSGATSTDDSKAPGTISDVVLGTLDNQYFNSTVDGDANTTRTAIINSSNWTGQSSSAIGYIDLTSKIGNSALPVELTSFTAILKKNNVELKWRTATEVNNYGFEIERKIPDQVRNDNLGWYKIGFVHGNGNSNTPIDYTFVDKNAIGATSFYYRLKQIDVDGKFEYSDYLLVKLNIPEKAELMQNSPNPFNPSTSIKFFIPNQSDVTIKVYDLLGREVVTLINKNVSEGFHIVFWDGKNKYRNQSTSGVYLYRLTAGSFSDTKKMILLK